LINSYFSSDLTKQKEIEVPKGHVWVEGDNKRTSYDSRHFGCVSKKKKIIQEMKDYPIIFSGCSRINNWTSVICYLAT